MTSDNQIVPPAPQGLETLRWIGPGIIWMISAVATGELIFTPRIASLYGYAVLWMLIAAIFLKAVIAREIGRYAVVTGTSFLEGMTRLPGPRNWGVWAIVLPQLVVAAATVAGMAGATGSAIILLFPGDFRLWGILFLAIAAALVLLGRYRAVEWASIVLSAAIILAVVFTASLVFPGPGPVIAGLVPALPEHADFTELLPWLGFIMSGAAGLMWYSYWINARGYGFPAAGGPVDASRTGPENRDRLKGWIGMMTRTTAVAAALVLILLIALLVLGSELLRPQGLLPEGPEVTAVLSRLLSDIWGAPGGWLMALGAFFAFGSTLIANLDGWGRMLGQGSAMIAEQFRITGRASSPVFFRNLYVLVLMGVLPALLFFILPEPVTFLVVAGIIEAIHIPVVTAATLYMNRRLLPPGLRPSAVTSAVLAIAAAFFAIFAVYYLYVTLL